MSISFIKGEGLSFYTCLTSRASGQIQSNPTLAVGDAKVSKDGGAFANLTTLPVVTPAASTSVKVTLSDAEANADTILIVFQDAAGAEWNDQFILLLPMDDHFWAFVEYVREGTTDHFTCRWFKRTNHIDSGITVPTIKLVKTDGTVVQAATAMTAGGNGELYLDLTSKMVLDNPMIVEVVATIESKSRTFRREIVRD